MFENSISVVNSCYFLNEIDHLWCE